jgi:hypothetical protein
MRTPRLHRYLWLLTGRNADFKNANLNTPVRFEVTDERDHIKEARDLLQLRRADTDFYVLGAMAALYSSLPALRGGPSEESVIFSPGTLRIPSPTVDGTFRPQDSRPISLVHRADDLPAAHTFRVSRKHSRALIETDNGRRYDAAYRHVDGTVYLDWPAEIPFVAAVRPYNGVWDDGSHFTIHSEPVGYPYAAVARRIKDSGNLIQLMVRYGTLGAFEASQSPIFKVGALVAAVVMRNLALSPSMRGDRLVEQLPGPEWAPPSDALPALIWNWDSYTGLLTYQETPLTWFYGPVLYNPP